MVYLTPAASIHPLINETFSDIDCFAANQKELGLLSFGVSVTKLEEVFLKVGEDEGVVSNKQ